MKRQATLSAGRTLAIVTVSLLAGVQIALFLFDFYDDGVADPLSLVIGIAILMVAIGLAVMPFVRRD